MSFQADPTLTWQAVTHGTYFMGLLGQHISALSETHLFLLSLEPHCFE